MRLVVVTMAMVAIPSLSPGVFTSLIILTSGRVSPVSGSRYGITVNKCDELLVFISKSKYSPELSKGDTHLIEDGFA